MSKPLLNLPEPEWDAWPWYIEPKREEAFELWSEEKFDNYTPDAPAIQKYKDHFIFVYGTQKKGFVNHVDIKGCQYLGMAITRSSDLVLYNSKDNFYKSVLLPRVGHSDSAHVQGEVYLAPTRKIFNLDYVMGHGEHFVRVKLPLRMLHPHEGQLVAAYSYIGMSQFWEKAPQSNGLKPSYLFRRKKAPEVNYYSYTKDFHKRESL